MLYKNKLIIVNSIQNQFVKLDLLELVVDKLKKNIINEKNIDKSVKEDNNEVLKLININIKKNVVKISECAIININEICESLFKAQINDIFDRFTNSLLGLKNYLLEHKKIEEELKRNKDYLLEELARKDEQLSILENTINRDKRLMIHETKDDKSDEYTESQENTIIEDRKSVV